MENEKDRVTVRIEDGGAEKPQDAAPATHVVFVPPDQRQARAIYLDGWRDGNSGSYVLYWAVFFLSFALAYYVFMNNATK